MISGGDAVSVHRVRIQADRGGDPVGVDLALPSGTPVGELLPTVLKLVDDRQPDPRTVQGWRLDRTVGGALAESLSLRDNGVRDGDVLVLAPEHAPPLGAISREPCAEVAVAGLTGHPAGPPLPAAASALTAVVAAAVLACSGPSTANLIVAATGAGIAVAVALTVGRPTMPGVAAVTLAAATGFLAVPSGPAAPNVFLAAAAAFAAALLVLRLTGPSPTLCCAATLSVLAAVATVLTLPIATAGAVLTTTSLGLLSLAPRIAVGVAGLGPDHWTGDVHVRAPIGHATLTGLVAGCTAGAAAGTVLIALSALRHDVAPGGAVAFPALVAAVLLLRVRTHAERTRHIALAAAGLVCAGSAVTSAVATWPHQSSWVAAGLIATSVLTVRRLRIGPAVARTADRLEYAALAAVVPAALWVGGAYAFVGDGRLPWG